MNICSYVHDVNGFVLIIAENCPGYHQISEFTASKPDERYVNKLSSVMDP